MISNMASHIAGTSIMLLSLTKVCENQGKAGCGRISCGEQQNAHPLHEVLKSDVAL
jgi:hypothetical protein